MAFGADLRTAVMIQLQVYILHICNLDEEVPSHIFTHLATRGSCKSRYNMAILANHMIIPDEGAEKLSKNHDDFLQRLLAIRLKMITLEMRFH